MTPVPRLWRYMLASGIEGSFVTATAGHSTRTAVADVLIHPTTAVLADARALIAGSFAYLPGLTIAAVASENGTCVVGDRSGDFTLIHAGNLEFAAAATYTWLLDGRRLDDLASVRVQPDEPGTDPLHLRSTDLFVQLQRLDQISPNGHHVITALGHVGETDQNIRLIDR